MTMNKRARAMVKTAKTLAPEIRKNIELRKRLRDLQQKNWQLRFENLTLRSDHAGLSPTAQESARKTLKLMEQVVEDETGDPGGSGE